MRSPLLTLHLPAVVWLGFTPLLIGLVVALRMPLIPVVMRLQRAVDGLATRVPAPDDVCWLLALGVRYEMALRVVAVLALLLEFVKLRDAPDRIEQNEKVHCK